MPSWAGGRGPARPMMVGWPETRRSCGPAHGWGCADGGRLARRFTESSIARVGGALRGTASLVSPSEFPAAVARVTRRGGPGPPLGLAARWVSESKLRGPQGLASCGRLSASPSEEWPNWVVPTFTCWRLGHFGLPRVGPSYLLEGLDRIKRRLQPMLSAEASGCRESWPGRLTSSPRALPLRRVQGGVELGP